MTRMKPQIEEPLPPWATGRTSEICIGSQLSTRDGRRRGNACVTGREEIPEIGTVWHVLTDAGNSSRFTAGEIDEIYYPPMWTMDVAQAPGYRVPHLCPDCRSEAWGFGCKCGSMQP